jgi:hypothetical protein
VFELEAIKKKRKKIEKKNKFFSENL